MKKRLLKFSNENGYFLVATFVILAVLLVFGAVILRITLAEYKQAEFDKNQIKAYYLARSGAELTADAIINEDLDAIDSESQVIKGGYESFSLKIDNEGFAEITLSEGLNTNPKNYWIESTSTINDVKEVVSLEIRESTLFDKPLFTNDNIDLTSNNSFVNDNEIIVEDGENKIVYVYDSATDKYINEGDNSDYYEYSEDNEYYFNADDPNNPNDPDNTLIYEPNVGVESKLDIIDPQGDVDEEYKITYSDREMPSLEDVITWDVLDGQKWPKIHYDDNLGTPKDDVKVADSVITGDGYYNNISVNGDVTFNTFAATSGQQHIVVDNIEVKGEVNIKDTTDDGQKTDNSLIVYVNPGGTASFKTPNEPPDNLLVFLGAGATFNVQANSEFNGFIYGPEATVIMNSADTKVNGAIFVDQLNLNKNPDQDTFQGTIEYEPFPSNFFGGSNLLPVGYIKGRWR
jgi:hypothetical protein